LFPAARTDHGDGFPGAVPAPRRSEPPSDGEPGTRQDGGDGDVDEFALDPEEEEDFPDPADGQSASGAQDRDAYRLPDPPDLSDDEPNPESPEEEEEEIAEPLVPDEVIADQLKEPDIEIVAPNLPKQAALTPKGVREAPPPARIAQDLVIAATVPRVGEDTPQAVKSALKALAGGDWSDPQFSLTREVLERSRIVLDWSWRMFHVHLFRAGHTGPPRTIQTFVCPHHGCGAYIKYDVTDGQIKVHRFQAIHDHPIQYTTCRGLSSLWPQERDDIREMVKQKKTPAQIHQTFHRVVAPGVLHDTVRDLLNVDKGREAQKLDQELKNWDDFETQMQRDKATGTCAGAYMFHKRLANTAACREVLIMDDTACSNHFGLPLFVVLGVDEHDRKQVVAFAYLFDRTADTFEQFLKWLKLRLGGDENPTLTPRAIVTDRHEGQHKAISTVFRANTSQQIFARRSKPSTRSSVSFGR
jgi:hypothetical protein